MKVRLCPLYSDMQIYESDKTCIRDLVDEFRRVTGSRFNIRVFLGDRLVIPNPDEAQKEIPTGTPVTFIEDMNNNRCAWY